MGLFRIEIEAVGGHGCNRRSKDGESIEFGGCQRMNCPDCLAHDLVNRLKRLGLTNLKATFTHWPGDPSQVVDDLVANIRHGEFKG